MIGFAQAMALIPGVSRSGGTLTAGLLLNLDPGGGGPVLVPAGHPGGGDVRGVQPRGRLRTVRARARPCPPWRRRSSPPSSRFVIGYAAIAWLLRYVAHHTLYVFVLYRVALGTLVLALLMTGTISAT